MTHRPHRLAERTRHPAKPVGFTLIELLVTLSVLAILASMAAPSFSSFVATQRTKNASLDLAAALTLARSEAVTRNTSVSVNASSSWSGGWAVTAGTTQVRSFGPYQGIAISTTSGTSLAMGNDGRPVAGGTSFQLSTAAPAQSTTVLCLVLSGTGRVSVANGACA